MARHPGTGERVVSLGLGICAAQEHPDRPWKRGLGQWPPVSRAAVVAFVESADPTHLDFLCGHAFSAVARTCRYSFAFYGTGDGLPTHRQSPRLDHNARDLQRNQHVAASAGGARATYPSTHRAGRHGVSSTGVLDKSSVSHGILVEARFNEGCFRVDWMGPPTWWHHRQLVEDPLSPALDGRPVQIS